MQSFASATPRMRSHSLPPSEMKSLYGSTTRSAVISLSYVTVAMLPPTYAVTQADQRVLLRWRCPRFSSSDKNSTRRQKPLKNQLDVGCANGHRETGAVDWTRSYRSRTPYWGTDWGDTIRQVPTPELGIARTSQRYSFRCQAGYRSRTSYCWRCGHRSPSAPWSRG